MSYYILSLIHVTACDWRSHLDYEMVLPLKRLRPNEQNDFFGVQIVELLLHATI